MSPRSAMSSSSGSLLLRCLIVFLLIAASHGISKDLIYPHGDTKLPTDQDEVSSPEITLQVPIVFYGESYDTIYVNSNGLLSFLTEIPSFFNIQFPLDYPVIAPLYTNVDTRGSGTVYYRETQDALLLDRATRDIRSGFSSAASFSAKSLFIATWWNVGYFKQGVDKVNTYQAVVVSDGTDSYLILIYTDHGIQWIQGSGHASGLPDARAQAGLVSSDGRLFTLRGSGSDQIQNLDKWSNIGQPGVWLFHIGDTGTTGNVKQPDLIANEVDVRRPAPDTCRVKSTECHSKASCIDHNPGFCCVCQQGYYGNGITCLKDGIPLRVNGKVSGQVNGVDISQMDLQSYVVTADGRTYTAVSRVPEEIGFHLQSLNVLGGLISWLFAKPSANNINGYQLTGGILNQTVDLFFPKTGDKITLIQRYFGLDVFDQLRMETEVRGSLPNIRRDVKVQMQDYEEKYTKSEAGLIHSHSSHSYTVADSPESIPFTMDQTIQFVECMYAPLDGPVLRLKVARNFISYETREGIVRYAMTGKVVPPGDNDPCSEGQSKCGPHSSCQVEDDHFKCVCNRGYQTLYDVEGSDSLGICVDINECTTGTSGCAPHAVCINEPGGFSCQCPQGYTGDGRNCAKLPTCQDLNCHPDADCIEAGPGFLQCQCRRGYSGDGLYCVPHSQPSSSRENSCDTVSNCSPFAVCTPGSNGYTCVCLQGYKGDGYSCSIEQDTGADIDVQTPTCSQGVCWCGAGYSLAGQNCVRIQYENSGDTHLLEARPLPACFDPSKCACPRGYGYRAGSETCHPLPGAVRTDTMGPSRPDKLSCIILNTCHPYAQCVYNGGDHHCQCNAGYEGDGYDCSEIDVSCDQVDICHNHATCIYQETNAKAICMCNPGYQGDGTLCSPIEECRVDTDCNSNARCLWVSHQARHVCVCNDGFIREGPLCLQQAPASCNVHNNCNPNAICTYNRENNQHSCQCQSGYSGDGYTCTAVGCNVLNNCGQGAECVYDRQTSGYRCACKQGFRDNGSSCVPEQTCQENPFLCGPDASCVPGPRGYYSCQCNNGFTGNGVLCKAVSKKEGNFLLLNQGMATLRIPFNPTSSKPGRPIAIQNDQMAIGIDVDCVSGRVYWSDVTGSTIKSSNYDGSDVMVFLSGDMKSPEGISVDWVTRNIYWTDSSKDTIEMANLDTKERKTIASQGLVNPRGIAVYPAIGKLFWSDWNREAPKLEWANLDGSERAIFLEGASVQLPNSLAIDFQRDELCWADAGSKQIECIGISRPIKRTLVTNCSYPFGLTISADNYYWTDWDTRKIESAQRPSGKRNNPITVPLGGSGKLYGIVAVPENCPR